MTTISSNFYARSRATVFSKTPVTPKGAAVRFAHQADDTAEVNQRVNAVRLSKLMEGPMANMSLLSRFTPGEALPTDLQVKLGQSVYTVSVVSSSRFDYPNPDLRNTKRDLFTMEGLEFKGPNGRKITLLINEGRLLEASDSLVFTKKESTNAISSSSAEFFQEFHSRGDRQWNGLTLSHLQEPYHYSVEGVKYDDGNRLQIEASVKDLDNVAVDKVRKALTAVAKAWQEQLTLHNNYVGQQREVALKAAERQADERLTEIEQRVRQQLQVTPELAV